MKRISISIVAALLLLAGGLQAFATTIPPYLAITDPTSSIGKGNQGHTNYQYGYLVTVAGSHPLEVTDLDVFEAVAGATVPLGVQINVGLYSVTNCHPNCTYTKLAQTVFGSISSAIPYPVALTDGPGTPAADLYQSITPVYLQPGGEYEIVSTGFSSAYEAVDTTISVSHPNTFSGIQNGVTYLNEVGTLFGTSGTLTSGYLLTTSGAQGPNAAEYEAASFEFTPVPEPGTLFLLGTGVLGLAGVVRRKFRTKTAA